MRRSHVSKLEEVVCTVWTLYIEEVLPVVSAAHVSDLGSTCVLDKLHLSAIAYERSHRELVITQQSRQVKLQHLYLSLVSTV